MYSIKELADLAGTTTRTLRYYDQQGLLAPARIGKNGYRYYDRESLLTLQQILFYRELDVPLKEIGFYLSRPDFQILPSLKDHQQAIGKRISRYQKLLDTIQRTISDIEGEGKMNAKDFLMVLMKKHIRQKPKKDGEIPPNINNPSGIGPVILKKRKQRSRTWAGKLPAGWSRRTLKPSRMILRCKLPSRTITSTSTSISTAVRWSSCVIWRICGSRIRALRSIMSAYGKEGQNLSVRQFIIIVTRGRKRKLTLPDMKSEGFREIVYKYC
jgi:DNA-binding transcriptional MerR regulator